MGRAIASKGCPPTAVTEELNGIETSFPLGNYGNYGIGEWLCPKLLDLKMYQNVTVYLRLIETTSDIWGVESVESMDMVRQCLSAIDNDYSLQ